MLQDAGSSTEAGVYYTTAEAGSAAEPAAIADLEDGAARNAASSHDTVAADGNACVEAAPCTGDELRILVSIEQRMLWLVDGQDTLLSAPVAIGMGKGFTWGDREYHFETPRGTRKVLAKAKDPVWIVPEWHYYEKAAKLSLDSVVRLERGDRIQLSDSSYLVVMNEQVGRINHFDHFSPFTPGTEIIFDGVMYVPPQSTAQRRVPDALGPYKLDTGDGYLIHGTHIYNEESIGEAVSHGCIRMSNDDLARLYALVPRGTPVIIF
jgi:lipoprotein-anchoring transpeptidase ErfK/SrfK